MSIESYTSRKGDVPCGDSDLYAFITDMRNFRDIVPPDEILISDWEATEDSCSFKVEKSGKVAVTLGEALPHSMVTYSASTFLTGNVTIQVFIEFVTNYRSKFYITASLNMNPFLKIFAGDSAKRYLDSLVDAIERYNGYEKIRGCNQSL